MFPLSRLYVFAGYGVPTELYLNDSGDFLIDEATLVGNQLLYQLKT